MLNIRIYKNSFSSKKCPKKAIKLISLHNMQPNMLRILENRKRIQVRIRKKSFRIRVYSFKNQSFFFFQKLLVGRADSAVVWLQPGVEPAPAAHPPAPHVGGLGPRPRHVPLPAPGQLIGLLPDTHDQCCGSMTFWYGSGTRNFRHWPSRHEQKTSSSSFIYSQSGLQRFIRFFLPNIQYLFLYTKNNEKSCVFVKKQI